MFGGFTPYKTLERVGFSAFWATRWAPTSYKSNYSPYKQGYNASYPFRRPLIKVILLHLQLVGFPWISNSENLKSSLLNCVAHIFSKHFIIQKWPFLVDKNDDVKHDSPTDHGLMAVKSQNRFFVASRLSGSTYKPPENMPPEKGPFTIQVPLTTQNERMSTLNKWPFHKGNESSSSYQCSGDTPAKFNIFSKTDGWKTSLSFWVTVTFRG